ncbi:RAC-alpha serine/threonine-protein kinase [Datura stramonium]|uniref:RAC-alpha serine/threonine-protein kinase n=1 Tax=Datura stramonium TaxID=4076 RepID=A0ABS8WRY8_DATST|nr:RAC-alpha serine/threonine-protein kinase [Datura stramonium]
MDDFRNTKDVWIRYVTAIYWKYDLFGDPWNKLDSKFEMKDPVMKKGVMLETEHMLTLCFSTRVITVSCPEKADTAGELVLLTNSFQQLLDIGSKIYGIKQAKVLSKDGTEIDNFELIRDGDQVNG